MEDHNLETKLISERVSVLEQWRTDIDLARAKEGVEKNHMDKRFDTIENKLVAIEDTGKKLTWTIISAVIVYIVTFAMNGGFNIVK